MKETKIRLNENSEELKKFKDAVLSKAHAQKTLLGYLSQFVTIDETTLLESGDIKLNAIEVLKAKYSNDFPSYISIDKILELVDFSMTTFQTLIDKYKFHDIKGYNPTTQSAPIIDFGIYAQSPEEIERYKLAKNMVDALKSADHVITNGLQIRESISQHIQPIVYNRFNNTFEINVKYILGK
jgi:hypothetical protein